VGDVIAGKGVVGTVVSCAGVGAASLTVDS